MKANILDGKKLAQHKRQELQHQLAVLRREGLPAPHLVVILVGTNSASELYVANKRKACEAIGVCATLIRFGIDITEDRLLQEIELLNRNTEVDGILVQLPLPRHIDATKVLLAMDPSKDVDGFHPKNMGLLALKMPGLRPATPKGIMMMLEHYVGEVMGMNAVVVGSSNIVGRPMALELLNHRATVTVCHSRTKDLRGISSQADLIIAAVGVPHLIQADFVKPGAIVVDVGINHLADGSLVGDVAFDEVSKIAAWVSPVPGGVGPMTIVGLLDNTIQAFKARRHP